MNKKNPLVIGHRGASALMPENTLESFRLAFGEHAADMIEFDVHLSRDGIPVVIHDETLERTTNGQGFVANKTFAELKSLNAGYGFDPEKNFTFPTRDRQIRIPSLEEVFQEFPNKRLAIEIKAVAPGLVQKVLDLVEKFNAVERCTVGSLEDSVFQELQRLDAPTRIFTSRKAAQRLVIEYFLCRKHPSKKPRLVASLPVENKYFDLKKKSWIDWLHEKEILVYYWTVNTPDLMRTLAERGADGIMSDDPGLIRRTLLPDGGTAP